MTPLLVALSNAILLYGLYCLDWAPATVAFMFWFEAAAIGAFTLIKVAASLPAHLSAPQPGAGKSLTYRRLPRPGGNTRVSSSVPRVNPLLAVPLFVVFYGALLVGYGALLLFSLHEPEPAAVIRNAVASGGVQLAMVLVVGQQLWAFWHGYVRGPAWQRSDPTFHFWQPFGLAILAWLVFFFGFLMLAWLQSPLVVLTMLIVLKTLAEMFNAVVDAQAGEWRRADDEARS